MSKWTLTQIEAHRYTLTRTDIPPGRLRLEVTARTPTEELVLKRLVTVLEQVEGVPTAMLAGEVE